MIQWLLDGSALLVGSALLNPATGAWTALPVGPDTWIAVGTEGRTATLDVQDGSAPMVRVQTWGASAQPVALPSGLAGSWALELVGDEVYVHLTSRDTAEASCWSVSKGVATALSTCLEGSFYAIHGLIFAGTQGVVVSSHGEGHPAVDLIRWDGEKLAPVPMPWVDLYPFGPLELLPRTDGSFDILTRCTLGPERPCLGNDGNSAEGDPPRWYRWTPGSKPKLIAKGKKAEVVPDPSSDRVAYLAGEEICVSGSGKKASCFSIPPEPPPAPAADATHLWVDPRLLTWDDAAGTATFSPGSDRMSDEYTLYVMDGKALETVLGGRPDAPVELIVERISVEETSYSPDDPSMPSPQGGFMITTIRVRVVGKAN